MRALKAGYVPADQLARRDVMAERFMALDQRLDSIERKQDILDRGQTMILNAVLGREQ